jgi:UDP-N-acetylglucosamine 2-epimerase (non-hydrolysing)
MKIMTLLGKRSEMVKLSLIVKVIDQHAEHILVHTGEQSDESLADIFFRDLEIRTPDIDLRDKAADPAPGDIERKAATLIREFTPDRILVIGNSMSSVAAAVHGGASIYQLDAGRRESDAVDNASRAVDATSHVLMPFSRGDRDNLLKDGIDGSRIVVVGSPVREVLDSFDDRIEASGVMSALGVNPFDFFLATIHRKENLTRDALSKIVTVFGSVAERFGKTVLFVTHPESAAKMEEYKLAPPPRVRMLRAVNYFDLVKLEKNSLAVISDSTTIQEECAVLRVPNITLRSVTPRKDTLGCGSNMLAGIETDDVLRAIEISIAQPAGWDPPAEYLRGNVSQIVSKILLSAK